MMQAAFTHPSHFVSLVKGGSIVPQCSSSSGRTISGLVSTASKATRWLNYASVTNGDKLQQGIAKPGCTASLSGKVCKGVISIRSRVEGNSQLNASMSVAVTDDVEDNQAVKTVRIHYNRKDGKYDDWGLHIWGDTDHPTAWEKPLHAAGSDEFGMYWELSAKQSGNVYFLIHSGRGRKEFEGQLEAAVSDAVWVVSGYPSVFTSKPDLATIPKGDLGLAKAFWVLKDLIVWTSEEENASFTLHASPDAGMTVTGEGVEGASVTFQLEVDPLGPPLDVKEKFPHISNYIALRVPAGVDLKRLVKSQLAVSSCDASGAPLNATALQLPGVLDDAYAYDGPLGASFEEDKVSLNLWAPTAQDVRLFLFSSAEGGEPCETVQLEDSEKGVWTADGPLDWKGKYYVYEVTVFHPSSGKVEKCLASDPYARVLSANGERSFIFDLNEQAVKPEGWADLANQKPALAAFTDIAIYELHIRDFSIGDETVDPEVRGTYLAFAQQNSAGVKHLSSLAEAGLTHVHLLPAFDFSSVDEKKENWKSVSFEELSKMPPDSEEQQAAVVAIQDEDGYNWGYDPVNWGVPEGSYASDPNGPVRTLEFRKMVQSLNHLGLRVVLDVVYNHLHGSGPTGVHSVLDKVVPGYYLRCNKDGVVENSTCMNNTASEHYMVDRLIVDDLLHWATAYKVDGFRFDLMGHLMKRTMLRAKSALQSLTVEKDGVDGSKIYLYGEGWDFGEISNNGRGVNASQKNLAGTGIGSFNDRIRDTAMGGSPFGDPLQQGFLTGLSLQPNELDQGNEESMAKHLASTTDWICLGMASNLKDFVFTNYEGKEVKGTEVLTHDGVPVAYASSPEDLINYVSAHDNETLFDVIMLKTSSEVSLEERCRINHMATSIVALAQGIPFFHAGDDTLRSKSLDRDSYNSGDWFNKLDWTYESNNFGVGLPPKSKNGEKWPIMRKLLGDPSLKPTKEHIVAAVANLKELLRIRFSSPLFRLKTGNAIQARLKFHNAGPAGMPGVIMMSVVDGDKGKPGLAQLDATYRRVVVVLNARPTELVTQIQCFKFISLSLHPVHTTSHDKVVQTSSFESETGTFTIPARTTAVFVETR
ncbi:unnamed protein product [Calypogeia fissa]